MTLFCLLFPQRVEPRSFKKSRKPAKAYPKRVKIFCNQMLLLPPPTKMSERLWPWHFWIGPNRTKEEDNGRQTIVTYASEVNKGMNRYIQRVTLRKVGRTSVVRISEPLKLMLAIYPVNHHKPHHKCVIICWTRVPQWSFRSSNSSRGGSIIHSPYWYFRASPAGIGSNMSCH